LFNLSTISAGVFLGTPMPYQVLASSSVVRIGESRNGIYEISGPRVTPA
jgi:hypothetical protein